MFDLGQGRQAHLTAVSARHIQLLQGLRAKLERRCHFQHHPVLAGLGKDGRDQALAEGVVQRAVDARQAHTEARGLVAVDLQVGLQALVLQVAGHIGKLGQLLQALQQFWRPDAQGVHIRVLQAELVLGAGDAVFQAEVLHRLQIQATAGQLGNLRLQATDHLLGRNIAFFMGLEVDQQPPGVERRVAAIHANKRRQAGHRRVA